MVKLDYRLLLALALISVLASCNLNKREDAIKLSAALMVANDSLSYYGKEWNEELKIAVNTRNFTGLPPSRKQLEAYIDRKIAEIDAMEDVGGSQKLKAAEVDILAFEKTVIQTKFAAFEQFNANTPLDQITHAYESLLQQRETEVKKMEGFQKLQDSYAEKNDFPKPVGDFK
jgi:hypothetical protein